MKLSESLQHQPHALGFGTSGLRGLVSDMTDLECYINTAGFLRFLAAHDGLKVGDAIYIAGDLRNSTPRIMQAVAAAIADGGYKPTNCGKIPTPALAHYAIQQHAPCIMVSGSHIPEDRNGIKFYKRAGEVLKEDEASIHEAVGAVRAELYSQDAAASPFDATGAKRVLPGLDPAQPVAEALYKRRYLDVFAADSLKDKKIVVYQQSAVARDLLVDVFEALGATVVPIERADHFIPIDTDKITDGEKARFKGFAHDHPDAFAIISADGDSDRPIVIDETGTFQWGDLLGCVVAEFLGIKFAATVVSANDAVDAECAAKGIASAKTKIGSPYVISAMMAAPADQRPAAAWEMNGGFLLGDDVRINGKVIKALPTRDSLLPILSCLMSAVGAGISVSELFARLPQRFLGGGMVDVPEPQIAAFRAVATDTAAMSKLAAELFTDKTLGTITGINLTDGLRVHFSSNDVIHLRPSGNAPQFRVYTTANTQDRADELTRAALANDGYINQLLALVAAQPTRL
jgi:phosphomannomutase